MRRISKRRTIIHKMISSLLLGCECPADVASELSATPRSDGFYLPDDLPTGLQSSPCVFVYLHPATKDRL